MKNFSVLFIHLSISVFIMACGGTRYARSYSAPTSSHLHNHVVNKHQELSSVNLSARMAYRQKGTRIKPTVLIMAQKGSYIRINALGLGDNVEADFACNGSLFTYQSFRKDCQLQGLCDKHAVFNLLRMNIAPDEFLLLTVGSVPIIEHSALSLDWDSKNQQERLVLINKQTGQNQTIVFDGKNKTWDVLSAKITNKKNEIEWSVENKDFVNQKDENGQSWRVPRRTRFKQPQTNLEIEIRWSDRKINPQLDAQSFDMTPEPGLRSCHQ